MLAKRIIPCLDVEKGRVVKGIKFVDIRDAGDPVDAARAYDKAGADELVFLDITGQANETFITGTGVMKISAQCMIHVISDLFMSELVGIHYFLHANSAVINFSSLRSKPFIILNISK